jgi:hypothetical protein
MRALPILLFILISLKANTQINSSLVSLTGIGDIKLGMKKTELEKLTGTKIKLVNLLRKDEDWARDTINIKWKELDYQLVIDKDYITGKGTDYIVYEINSKSPQLKTKSGIGLGDDKLKIVSTYQDFMLHIIPDYEPPAFNVKSKTKSSLWLFGDTSGTVIIFYLTNNKVTGFCVMYNEGC